MGAAVCSIGGTGCSASQCLTCQAPKYWRYYRAEDGATTFRPSGGGASSSRVGDGDVEAWVWGNSSSAGAVPSIDSVCGARPTTTTSRPSTTVPRPIAPAPGPTAPAPTGLVTPPGATSPVLPLPGGTTTTAQDVTTTTAPDDDDRPTTTTTGDLEVPGLDEGSDPDLTIVPAGGELAGAASDQGPSGGESGGWWGVAAVTLVLAGIAAWALVLRRRGMA
jgi:hypothetical protein